MNMILAAGENLMTWLQAKMIYDITGMGFADNLNWVLGGGTSYDKAWEVVSSFSESIKVVASTLLLIHFLCYILESVTREQISTDIFFKGFIKFIIGFFIVQNCTYLFDLLMDIGNILMKDMSLSSSGTITVEDIEAGLKSGGHFIAFNFKGNILDSNALVNVGNFFTSLINVIVCMPTTFLFWVIAFASVLIIAVLMITRTLELVVRALFAPIAIVDIFEHGTNGSGFKYMKKFLAVAIQGAVIMVIMMMIGSLAGLDVGELIKAKNNATGITWVTYGTDGSPIKAMSDFLDQTVISANNATNIGNVLMCYAKCVVFTLAGVGLAMKSQPICNDIVGV